MPALLVRATVALGGGEAVPESDRDAIKRIAPHLRVVELDRNHFGIMTDNRAVAAIADLLGEGS